MKQRIYWLVVLAAAGATAVWVIGRTRQSEADAVSGGGQVSHRNEHVVQVRLGLTEVLDNEKLLQANTMIAWRLPGRGALSKELSPAVHADYLLMTPTEQTKVDRRVSRHAGLPLWPRDTPWPTGARGEPLRLVYQFAFCDSLDLLPADIPAHILLLFEDMNSTRRTPGFERFVCKWVDCRERDLIEAAPKFSWTEKRPRHAVLLRLDEAGDGQHLPEPETVIPHTKIGGAVPDLSSVGRLRDFQIPGPLLCLAGSDWEWDYMDGGFLLIFWVDGRVVIQTVPGH